MLSLISTLGGLLISGLPKLLEYFQNKADQAHELRLAQVQTERELQLAAAGFAAQSLALPNPLVWLVVRWRGGWGHAVCGAVGPGQCPKSPELFESLRPLNLADKRIGL